MVRICIPVWVGNRLGFRVEGLGFKGYGPGSRVWGVRD